MSCSQEVFTDNNTSKAHDILATYEIKIYQIPQVLIKIHIS
jgi:hypothetical protein